MTAAEPNKPGLRHRRFVATDDETKFRGVSRIIVKLIISKW